MSMVRIGAAQSNIDRPKPTVMKAGFVALWQQLNIQYDRSAAPRF